MPIPLTDETAGRMRDRNIFFIHRPDCQAAEMTEEPSHKHREALKVTCVSCRRFLLVYPPKPGQLEAPTVTLASRWRCRTHPDEPVTWRGNGCRVCTSEAAMVGR